MAMLGRFTHLAASLYPVGRERLLQECYLAGMIEIVLRYADELRIGSVGGLGDQWLI